MQKQRTWHHHQRGSSLIEILITIVILAFGLLSLAKLQAGLQQLDMDSYQRAQALILMSDMAGRISNNRYSANQYVTSLPLGTGISNCDLLSANNGQAQADIREWCAALQGTNEIAADDTSVGAMIGARGCVESIDAGYLVTVAWQGLKPVSAPPASISCGKDSYDDSTICADDACRRTVTTVISIASLN